MYWSNQEVDNTIYPPCCPGCYALKWLDFDWQTGLGYCRFCGLIPAKAEEAAATAADLTASSSTKRSCVAQKTSSRKVRE